MIIIDWLRLQADFPLYLEAGVPGQTIRSGSYAYVIEEPLKRYKHKQAASIPWRDGKIRISWTNGEKGTILEFPGSSLKSPITRPSEAHRRPISNRLDSWDTLNEVKPICRQILGHFWKDSEIRRIDLAVNMKPIDISQVDWKAPRSRKGRTFYQDGKVSGVTLGQRNPGSSFARLYQKHEQDTQERFAASQKFGTDEFTRLEYEIPAGALQRYGFKTIGQLLKGNLDENLTYLWSCCCTEKCFEHPGIPQLARDFQRLPPLQGKPLPHGKYLRLAAGYLQSYLALSCGVKKELDRSQLIAIGLKDDAAVAAVLLSLETLYERRHSNLEDQKSKS